MIRKIKKFIPNFIINFYHFIISYIASFVYGFPSEKMIVIGVTGTKGKSSTCYILSQVLEGLGYKVGLSSGVVFKIGDKEWLNSFKMTMPGRFKLQKLLRDMTRAGCQIAIVETTSEGIKQYRHKGINYDIAVFTNLHPEHIESHGSFENYKKAKGKLFRHLSQKKKKVFFNKKIIIVNLDDEHCDYFLNFKADEKIGFGTKIENNFNLSETIKAYNCEFTNQDIRFIVDDVEFSIPLLGNMNLYNTLAALSCAIVFEKDKQKIAGIMSQIKSAPGRVEFIREGQDFDIIVDYAHDPYSLENLFQTLKQSSLMDYKKVIHVFGATGGGRDISKRPLMGKISDKYADIIILTNDDPYDDNEIQIIEDIYEGIINKNKVIKITDRKQAIERALSIAEKKDLVVITGKGAEQKIILADGYHDWDDRKVIKNILNKQCKRN